MLRPAVLALGGLALLVSTPADAGPDGRAATTHKVALRDFHFSPVRTSAEPGDVIRFKWRGEYAHTVKFTKAPKHASKPRSCKLRVSGTCLREVAKRGLYRYKCTIHGDSYGMRGRIEVE